MAGNKSMHGAARAVGCTHVAPATFCRLLPKAPSWAASFGGPQKRLTQADAEKIASDLGGPGGIMDDVNGKSPDSRIPAAYTFFAQFVDHDLTLDVGTELHGPELSVQQVDALPNVRSASLDLDCVYGFGPEASPYLYDPEHPERLLVGSSVDGVDNPEDVPRTADGRALIGDPRNDENLFVSQMHVIFLRLHNLLLAGGRTFEDAQREARCHYQCVVLHDFLKRVCDPDIYKVVLPKIQSNSKLGKASRNYPFYLSSMLNGGRIQMPVEFSGAAYRFGHVTVRSHYPVNGRYPRIELFDERFGTTGFSQPPPEFAVDWRFLLDVDPDYPDFARSKAVDHLFTPELMRLPSAIVRKDDSGFDRSLAFRNLQRGYVLGLPSGQEVEKSLTSPYSLPRAPLDPNTISGWSSVGRSGALAQNTPLFLYLMHEAAVRGGGERLGPVGSAILMEVFGAIFVHCDTFLKDAGWSPVIANVKRDDLTLAHLIRYVSCWGK